MIIHVIKVYLYICNIEIQSLLILIIILSFADEFIQYFNNEKCETYI